MLSIVALSVLFPELSSVLSLPVAGGFGAVGFVRCACAHVDVIASVEQVSIARNQC